MTADTTDDKAERARVETLLDAWFALTDSTRSNLTDAIVKRIAAARREGEVAGASAYVKKIHELHAQLARLTEAARAVYDARTPEEYAEAEERLRALAQAPVADGEETK